MRLLFFHILTDQDSAEIRRFLVDKKITDKIQFLNIAYEENEKLFKEKAGSHKVPALVLPDGKVLNSKTEILSHLAKLS